MCHSEVQSAGGGGGPVGKIDRLTIGLVEAGELGKIQAVTPDELGEDGEEGGFVHFDGDLACLGWDFPVINGLFWSVFYVLV